MFKRQESNQSRVYQLHDLTKTVSNQSSALKQQVRRKGYIYEQHDTRRTKSVESSEAKEEEDELTKHYNFIVNNSLYKEAITDTDMIYGPAHPSKAKYRNLQTKLM